LTAADNEVVDLAELVIRLDPLYFLFKGLECEPKVTASQLSAEQWLDILKKVIDLLRPVLRELGSHTSFGWIVEQYAHLDYSIYRIDDFPRMSDRFISANHLAWGGGLILKKADYSYGWLYLSETGRLMAKYTDDVPANRVHFTAVSDEELLQVIREDLIEAKSSSKAPGIVSFLTELRNYLCRRLDSERQSTASRQARVDEATQLLTRLE